MVINMYGGIEFFAASILLLIPAIALRLLGKRVKCYGLLASIIMIILAMGLSVSSIVQLIIYCSIEYMLINSMLRITSRSKPGKLQYWLHIALSIMPLAVVKVSGVFDISTLGFIGLSYMTFKSLQIIIDVNDGIIKEVKLINFLLFILLFPTVLCGPIDRSRRFDEDIDRTIPRDEYVELIGQGLFKLLLGAVYKFVLANLCVLAGTTNMYIYGFYMFFDFAGYSLMAIGISYIMGIRTPDNFKMPWISIDMKDFWNRWHMTLSFWLRDYLFSRCFRRCIRAKMFAGNRLVQSCMCLILNMAVMGVWHGLELHLIVYGIYHGVLLALTEIYQKKSTLYKKYKTNKLYMFVSWAITFNLIMFGFYIFSGQLF